ncbi:MAG: hypothetical protein HY720_11400 [Planctomycetes bacterium]|nr:hypothetical protein [Planctomycetota bacterium]
MTLPLVGLLCETVLPGEERTVEPPVVEETALAALASAGVSRLAVLTITSALELPALVTARWGTECEVLSVAPKALQLRGVRRVRLLEARGAKCPYEGDFEAVEDPSPPLAGDVVRAAHSLFAALELGAVPEAREWQERLCEVVPGLLRAVCPPEGLRESLRLPPHEAVRKIAQELAARTPGEPASCDVERALRELTTKPDLRPKLKQRP